MRVHTNAQKQNSSPWIEQSQTPRYDVAIASSNLSGFEIPDAQNRFQSNTLSDKLNNILLNRKLRSYSIAMGFEINHRQPIFNAKIEDCPLEFILGTIQASSGCVCWKKLIHFLICTMLGSMLCDFSNSSLVPTMGKSFSQ